MILYFILALVAAQRLVEVWYAARNTRRLLARGAVEIAPWQHPLFIALHAGWLLSLALFVPPSRIPNGWMLAAFALLQCARLWVLVTLGPFWTTRIVSLPDAPLVRAGPYRFMRHPNYGIVVCEIALLPAAFGAWSIAIIFSLANAVLLTLRIRSENDALAAREHLAR
ncbi:MAG TPA: isoprenylcysteine carboxylmethyltransferase family protein [Candidatus Aquilonibacter sp.]|nr:isoprenylcysteine carboxylmethyltransferase family protein [Candidatus Aquilonibacter sp.]